jgi:hypothetical protein
MLAVGICCWMARFAFTDFWDRGSLMMLGCLAQVGSLTPFWYSN